MNRHRTLVAFVLILLTAWSGFCRSLFSTGKDYYYRKKFEIALITLRRSLLKHPANSEAYFYIGNILVHKGRYKEALSNYKIGLDLTTKPARFLLNMGRTYHLLRRFPQAIAAYKRAAASDPTLTQVHLDMGTSYFSLEDKTNTIVQWETYLKKEPDNSQADNIRKAILALRRKDFLFPSQRRNMDDTTGRQADAVKKKQEDRLRSLQHLRKGIVLFKQGKFQAARLEFDKSLFYNKENAKAYSWRGRTWLQLKKYTRALKDAGEALKRDASDPRAWFTRGEVYYRFDQNDNARQAFQKAIEFQPGNSKAHYRLGYLHYVSKDFTRARLSYRNANRYDPTSFKSLYNLGKVEERLGHSSAAIQAYKKCIALNPAYFKAQLNLGILYYKSKMYIEAIRHFRLASRLKPANASVSLYLGQVYDEMKSYRKAIPYYRGAFLSDPNSFPAAYNLGRMYGALGRNVKAVELYRKALLIKPLSVDALCNLGNSLLKLQRPGEALQHLKKAGSIKQDDVETNLALSRAYRLLGRYVLAASHVQRVIAVDPGSHEAYLSKGLILNARGLYAEAIRAFFKALEFKPFLISARFNLAEAYRLNRQYGKALEMYERVLKEESTNGLSYQRKGEIYLLQGRKAAARSVFRKLLRLLPRYSGRSKILAYLRGLR